MNCESYFFLKKIRKRVQRSRHTHKQPNLALPFYPNKLCWAGEIKMKIELQSQYKRNAHNVGGSFWHLQWCTKYRYKMFGKEHYRNLCRILLLEAAKRYKIVILTMNVQPDHLHLVAQLPRGMSDSRALQLLKGYVSRVMFLQAPEFEKRYPKHELWGNGTFSTTVGFVNLEETVNYIENQDEHHKLYPAI